MDDVLKELDWDTSNIALPIANAENKLLEEAVTSKTSERNRLQSELEVNRNKVNALYEHVKNVRDELAVTQNLLGARENELETENHLKLIAEREAGRLMQEVQRLKTDYTKLKERRNIHENEIFIANQQFDAMKSQMKWDQQALEAWLEESAQKDEDAITLQKYSKQDESKIKGLILNIEKLVEHSQKQKKLVDDETLNTMTIQVELDKTAEEFRKTHKERQDLIKQWEYIIDQMQRRDGDIDDSAQQLIKMNVDISKAKDELDAKKKFYEDQSNNNSDLQRNINILDQTIADTSLRLNRDDNARQQFQDELGGLKRTVERTGHDLDRTRAEVTQLKKNISEKRQLIEALKQGNLNLVDSLKRTVQTTMSAEENAKKMEELFSETKQHEQFLNQTMKKRSEQQFKVSQEIYELKATQKGLEAEINGCESSCKNLESRINQLDHESLKQAEVIYGQDFSIQSLERRMTRLQGEKNNDEQLELAKKINVLKERKEEKENQHDILLTQFKRVEEDTRKAKRDIEELNKEKTYISSKIAELSLHIDTAQKLLKKKISDKEELMVDENLMKLEIRKLKETLESRADEVLDLNKRRIQLEMAMKERRDDINIQQDVLKKQLKEFEFDVSTITSELTTRVDKIDKLKKKYDIVMISMAPPEGTPPEENTQAYYVIKAAQEKEELQREGDTLNEQIKKAEKELRALENTLKVVNSKNDTIKKSYSKVGDQSDLNLKKEELEEQLMAISDTYKKKRRQLKQLVEDVENMEEAYNSMDKDEKNYQELISDKLNKIVQLEKDIKDQREKLERATKQLITFMRDVRRAKNSQGPTVEEKDFKQKDLVSFNNKKVRELVEVANQYPTLQQTLNILFTQSNITVAVSSQPNSQPPSTRTSRSSSRRSSVSNSSASSATASQQASVNRVKPVNIGFDLPKSERGSGSGTSTPKSGTSSRRSNH